VAADELAFLTDDLDAHDRIWRLQALGAAARAPSDTSLTSAVGVWRSRWGGSWRVICRGSAPVFWRRRGRWRARPPACGTCARRRDGCPRPPPPGRSATCAPISGAAFPRAARSVTPRAWHPVSGGPAARSTSSPPIAPSVSPRPGPACMSCRPSPVQRLAGCPAPGALAGVRETGVGALADGRTGSCTSASTRRITPEWRCRGGTGCRSCSSTTGRRCGSAITGDGRCASAGCSRRSRRSICVTPISSPSCRTRCARMSWRAVSSPDGCSSFRTPSTRGSIAPTWTARRSERVTV